LIEMMLVLALFGILASIAIPVQNGFLNSNDLDIAAAMLAQSYRRAQALSQSSAGDSSWGAYAATSTVAVFKGTSYAERDESYDEVFDMAGSIKVTGVDEVVFAKFTGQPGLTGTTTLTSANNKTRQVGLYVHGMVQY